MYYSYVEIEYVATSFSPARMDLALKLLTGKAKERKHTLVEIHTGLLWELARQRYCGDDLDAFPLDLVCFYDKTNTDVFGSLS
jgi:hypothetical protein